MINVCCCILVQLLQILLSKNNFRMITTFHYNYPIFAVLLRFEVYALWNGPTWRLPSYPYIPKWNMCLFALLFLYDSLIKATFRVEVLREAYYAFSSKPVKFNCPTFWDTSLPSAWTVAYFATVAQSVTICHGFISFCFEPLLQLSPICCGICAFC